MKLNLKTWNSININDGSVYNAYIRRGQLASISKNPVIVNRAGDSPFLSTVVKNANAIVIQVVIVGGQDINTKRELLKQYFFGDDNRHNLVAEDQNDSNRQYYRTGIPVTMAEEGGAPNSFFITIATEHQYWQLVTTTTDNWSVTATGQTNAFTNAGNITVPPKFNITPTTTKSGGLSYRRWVSIYNNLDISYVAPLDITSGGLDTATLTTAKMQADGDDFRVWIDGQEADRWLDSMDTAATKCWVNLYLSPRQEATTSVTISNVGAVTTITFSATRANKKFLEAMKRAANKVVLIDSEAFTFTGINLVTYQLTGCTRAQKGTSAATHTQPKTARWIEHDIWILYGDSSLTALDTDDTLKPIFDLSSTNGAWSWTNFFDTTNARPGAWKGEVLESRTGLSYVFTDDQNAFANPSAVLGLAMRNDADFQVANEQGTLDWIFSHPAGITDVVYSGDKYATGESWPEIVGLQYLQPNAAWFTQQNEDIPSPTLAWQSFGPHSETLPDTYKTIRFVIDGKLSSVLNESAMCQFYTLTATFDSANLPTISVGAEASVNFFDFTLTNNTTGEFIKCKTPCAVNTVLTIDCENKEAYLDDSSRVVVTWSTEREAWLDLRPGNNTLQYDDVGTQAVTVSVVHRDRNL